MSPEVRNALVIGLSDAAGFVLGALGGWSAGRLAGFDFFTSPGFDLHAMVGLGFILAGCGLGKWIAQRLRAPYLKRP